MCPELTPPDNGFVLFPCTREESHTCSVVCAHGYNISGSPQQTCELDPRSGDLLWTEPPTCQSEFCSCFLEVDLSRLNMCESVSLHVVLHRISGSDLCTSNPCLHGGVCILAGSEFTCNCSGTNYTGATCNLGIIRLPPIPVLIKGQTHNINVSTNLDLPQRVRILLFDNGTALRPLIVLDQHNRVDTFQYTPNEAGIHIITHKHAPKHLFAIEPSKIIVFVRESSEQNKPTNYYFTSMNLPLGQLKKGCCAPQSGELSASLLCPESTQQVTLKAACQWKNDGTTHWTPGVIFADGHNLSLPVSVAGYQYSQDGEGSVFSATSECTSCISNEPVCMQQNLDDDCYCYNFTGQDTQDFLNTHALGLTYIEQIQSLLPTWLKVQGILKNSMFTTTHSEHDYLAPIVQSHINVQAVEGCNEITPMNQGIYSVLRYDKILSGEIDRQTYTYDGRSESRGSSDPMCFAVNLCQGVNSPVFMQLSQPIQNILVSEHLRRFVDKGWKIQLNTVTISRSRMNNTINQVFWNGIRRITLPVIMSDATVNTGVQAMFTTESINMNVTFMGDANIQYQVRHIEHLCS